MTRIYYKCYSIECDGIPVVFSYSTTWDREIVADRYCGRCKQKNVLKVISTKEFDDAKGYNLYGGCLDCSGRRLVSRVSSRCKDCDAKRGVMVGKCSDCGEINILSLGGKGLCNRCRQKRSVGMGRDSRGRQGQLQRGNPIGFGFGTERQCPDQNCSICYPNNREINRREDRERILFPRFAESYEDLIEELEDDD